MAKTTPALATPLRDQLEKLAAFAPQDLPVLSLYLDLAADQHGRDSYDAFLRKSFAERRKAFRDHTAARASFDRDAERIREHLKYEVNRSTNALAVFACSGANDFFESIQLQAPIEQHWLFIGPAPHLYPLAKLADRFPRYAAVLTDTNRARIFVFSLGAVEHQSEVVSDKMRRNAMGGWSQARYQRHADNWHLLHVKDVVEHLDRIVSAENIAKLIIAGDNVAMPILKEQLPQRLLDKLVDIIRLETYVGEDELLRATLEALQRKDAESDIEVVQDVVGAWLANGLGTVAPEPVLQALTLGQVDELLIAATPAALEPVQDMDEVTLAGELVRRAEQTGARVRFIEDPELMKDFGGVAARLRFRGFRHPNAHSPRVGGPAGHAGRRVMSKLNKVNPDHYTMAGRLPPDDLARELKRQRGEVEARKGARPLPRRRVTGETPAPVPTRGSGAATPAVASETAVKESGARKTPKTRKAPAARGSAARGASPARAGRPGMHKGRTKGRGVTRKTQKKNRS